jgi:hypothetical protein
MTDRGRAALEETYQRQVDWVNELAIGFPSDDLTQVLKIMTEIRSRLDLESN